MIKSKKELWSRVFYSYFCEIHLTTSIVCQCFSSNTIPTDHESMDGCILSLSGSSSRTFDHANGESDFNDTC